MRPVDGVDLTGSGTITAIEAGQLREGGFPGVPQRAADQGTWDRPLPEQEILVQEGDQVLALSFGQDGAVEAHPPTRLLHVVGAAS
ncbi:hypothetical protein [Streptomyces sp. NPDC058398]|uniref:hypothetical protein n=1 Tax=Streptomyces sp. NPDC058398 TaxID=3346479 RepID=UPI003661F3BB